MVECFQLRHSLVRLFRFEEAVIAPFPRGALSFGLVEKTLPDLIAHRSPLENCIASTSIFREMQ